MNLKGLGISRSKQKSKETNMNPIKATTVAQETRLMNNKSDECPEISDRIETLREKIASLEGDCYELGWLESSYLDGALSELKKLRGELATFLDKDVA